MAVSRELIEQHPFFADLAAKHIAHLADTAEAITLKPGRFALRTGEPATRVYIIRSGRLALEIVCHGEKQATIQTLENGDILGWSWMIPPHEWRFDARAVSETELISVDGQYLREQAEDDLALGYTILQHITGVMAQRLAGTRQQLLELFSS